MDQALGFPNFPSHAHLTGLRRGLKEGRFNSWTTEELYYWHAYDYGWRRFRLGDARTKSPIDQEGKWFDQLLADQAFDFYRGDVKPRGLRIEAQWEIDARNQREAWAKEHGCDSFRHAMEIGLQAVGRRIPPKPVSP